MYTNIFGSRNLINASSLTQTFLPNFTRIFFKEKLLLLANIKKKIFHSFGQLKNFLLDLSLLPAYHIWIISITYRKKVQIGNSAWCQKGPQGVRKVYHDARKVYRGARIVYHGARKVYHGARKVTMVTGRSSMIPGKFTMVPARSNMVPRRSLKGIWMLIPLKEIVPIHNDIDGAPASR